MGSEGWLGTGQGTGTTAQPSACSGEVGHETQCGHSLVSQALGTGAFRAFCHSNVPAQQHQPRPGSLSVSRGQEGRGQDRALLSTHQLSQDSPAFICLENGFCRVLVFLEKKKKSMFLTNVIASTSYPGGAKSLELDKPGRGTFWLLENCRELTDWAPGD